MAHTKTISDVNQYSQLLQWFGAMVHKGLAGGPVVITLDREQRSVSQNSLLWPILTDISKQCTWPRQHGKALRPDEWKCLFMSAYRNEINQIIMGMNGEPVNLGLSTSKLKKAEFSELIEFLYAEGTTMGVKFSDPSLAIYEQWGMQ